MGSAEVRELQPPACDSEATSDNQRNVRMENDLAKNNSNDDDGMIGSMFCGLWSRGKSFKSRACCRAFTCSHFCKEKAYTFDKLTASQKKHILQYMESHEAIYLEELNSTMQGILKEGDWCEQLVLDGIWRTASNEAEAICKKWFPCMKGLKECYHSEPQIADCKREKAHYDALILSHVKRKAQNSKIISPGLNPSDESTGVGSPPSNLGSVIRMDSDDREGWTDIHLDMFTPLLFAARDSLETLFVTYTGNFREDNILRPVMKNICMSKLKLLQFTLLSSANSAEDNSIVGCDTEHVILACKLLELPMCDTIEIAGKPISLDYTLQDDNTKRNSNRYNPFLTEKAIERSPKSHKSTDMDVAEAFGKIITKPEALKKLNINLNFAEAELVADLLPQILEV